MGTGRQALQTQLGGRVPPELDELQEHQLHDLADAVATAKRRQAAEIAAAGDQALRHVPRLLRVAIRRVAG